MFQVLSFKFHEAMRIFGLLILIFGLFTALRVNAAVLYAGSAYQTIAEGQTFVIDWFLDTEGRPINTIALKLKFTTNILEAVEANAGQSVLSLWVKYPEFSNHEGTIELSGGIPGGLAGEKIPLFRTVFRAKAPGSARIMMEENSGVLLADGKGTPEKLSFQVLNFPVGTKGILPVAVSSPSHPDPDIWYRDNRVVIAFEPKSGEDYSYSFSSNLDIFPDDKKDESSGMMIYENLPDGIYYFKLNAKIGNSNWQEAGIFRVQIDTTPPEAFEPRFGTEPTIFSGKPFLSFSAVDKTSGISHYKIKAGAVSGIREIQSPYQLSRPLFANSLEIQAIDRAGNIRKVNIPYPGLLSWYRGAGILVLLFGAFLTFIFLRKYVRKASNN